MKIEPCLCVKCVNMRLTVLAIINILVVIIGVIIIIVTVSYLPSTGGTVPQDMTLEAYQEKQQKAIYSSNAFKGVISGCVITGLGIIMALVRLYLDNQRDIRLYQARVNLEDPTPVVVPATSKATKSILKVSRVNEP